MNHLDEMAGATRPAMQISLLGCAVCLLPAWRAGNVAAAGREGGEDRAETLHWIRFAADHHAIAALQPPDATARADVDIADPLGHQLLGSADVVDVVGIAAVNENVTALKVWQQIGNGPVDHARWHHQPDGAGLRELLCELRQRRGTDGFFLSKL